MNNQLLFLESRRLSLPKINESDRTDQPTLNMLRQILDLNEKALQIGVLWGDEDINRRVETVFLLLSAFGAYEFRRSLSAIVGSCIPILLSTFMMQVARTRST